MSEAGRDERTDLDAPMRIVEVPDAAPRPRRPVLHVLVLVPFIVAAVVGGVWLAREERGSARAMRAAAEPWRSTVSTTTTLVCLVVLAILAVLAVRRGVWRGRRSPLRTLPDAERRQLVRQIVGKAEVDPGRLPQTLEMARSMAVMPWTFALLVPATGNMAASALRNDSPVFWSMFGAFALFTVGSLLASSRHARKARRFLQRHRAADPA